MYSLIDTLRPCSDCEHWMGKPTDRRALCFLAVVCEAKDSMKHKNDSCPHWEQSKGLDLPDVFNPEP